MYKPPKKQVLTLLTVVFTFLLALEFAAAATDLPTRLNITVEEFVQKNVSYGRDFDYTDNVELYLITGFVNVTNPSNDTVYDIFLGFINTDFLLGNFSFQAGRNGSHFNGTAGDTLVYIHIPELRANESSLFNYTVNSSNITEPLDMETEYNLPQNNYYYQKVLAGENLTIRQNVTNKLDISENITNINITMATQGIFWNESSGTIDNFTFQYLYQTGDWNNVSNGSDEYRVWYWLPSNGTLESNQTVNITYVIQAPNSTPSSGTYLHMIETLEYQVNFVASNMTLNDVSAMAKANFSFEKRIDQPSTNNNDANVTWEIRPHITVPLQIAYNITKVTFWVTSDLNPNNYTNDTVNTDQQLNFTYYPNAEANLTQTWEPSSYWYFNYTDGSNGFPPPIVWMKPEYRIINDGNQILNQSFTYNSSDLYMKYIYVVAGYWLQVEKNVTSVGEDTYGINVTVWNIGNGPTPQNLTVTVYDFVPQGFTNGTMTPAPNAEQAVSGSYNGTAIQWDIPRKAPLNASLYARGDSLGRDYWNASYEVSGNGTYRVSDLYIVGLDPRLVDGAFGSPLISVITGFESYSKEILYFSIVLFLIILNTTNLVISTRINKKIDDHKKKTGLDGLEKELKELKTRMGKKKH